MATTPSNRRNTGIPIPKERDAAAKASHSAAPRQGAIEMQSRPKVDTSAADKAPPVLKPRREGGIVTPNGVAKVDPFYRNQVKKLY